MHRSDHPISHFDRATLQICVWLGHDQKHQAYNLVSGTCDLLHSELRSGSPMGYGLCCHETLVLTGYTNNLYWKPHRLHRLYSISFQESFANFSKIFRYQTRRNEQRARSTSRDNSILCSFRHDDCILGNQHSYFALYLVVGLRSLTQRFHRWPLLSSIWLDWHHKANQEIPVYSIRADYQYCNHPIH